MVVTRRRSSKGTSRGTPNTTLRGGSKPRGRRSSSKGAPKTKRRTTHLHSPPSSPESPSKHTLTWDIASFFSFTSAPDTIIGREEESKQIHDFLLSSLSSSHSSGTSCFISGVPGTGKTTVVLQTLAQLSSSPTLKKIFINGGLMSSTSSFYQYLLSKLFNRSTSQSRALGILEKYFCRRRSGNLVVVVDEADFLYNMDPGILYNLLNWFLNPNYVLILIANSLHGNSQLLARIKSRLGPSRVLFRDYSKDVLYSIISARFKQAGVKKVQDIFDLDALVHLCTKCGQTSGDARRALSLVYNCILIAISNNQPRVSFEIVRSAVNDERVKIFQLFNVLSKTEYDVLKVLYNEKISDVNQLVVKGLCVTQIFTILGRLESYNIIKVNNGKIDFLLWKDDLDQEFAD
ncbi:hypothetical protein P9112_007338 [Eukaryota sp. TZLM1-RC]